MRPKEIKKLIELVESSSINELEVSRFGRKVRIRKNPGNSNLASSREALTDTASSPVAPSSERPAALQEQPPKPQTSEKKTEQVQAADTNIIEIRSPMVGTFYRAPAPDADPYVEVGDIITPKQVLCIIEAMKLMNEIESEVRGRIVEILSENGKPVEYDQVLFRIEKL